MWSYKSPLSIQSGYGKGVFYFYAAGGWNWSILVMNEDNSLQHSGKYLYHLLKHQNIAFCPNTVYVFCTIRRLMIDIFKEQY
jgi:hypothetical protein